MPFACAIKAMAAAPAALERAYEAPFDGSIAAKAGARRFPWCIRFAEPEAGSAKRQAQTFEALKHWSKPAHVIFRSLRSDFYAGMGKTVADMIPGATLDAIERVGHFCQEDAGEEIAVLLRERAAVSRKI